MWICGGSLAKGWTGEWGEDKCGRLAPSFLYTLAIGEQSQTALWRDQQRPSCSSSRVQWATTGRSGDKWKYHQLPDIFKHAHLQWGSKTLGNDAYDYFMNTGNDLGQVWCKLQMQLSIQEITRSSVLSFKLLCRGFGHFAIEELIFN